MSQKIWVAHETPAKTFGPTRVSIDGCSDVDDFLEEIKKKSQLCIPSKTPITLYQPDGNTEIKPTDTINSIGNMGKDADAPLVVRSALIENGILKLHKIYANLEVKMYSGNLYATLNKGMIDVVSKNGKIKVNNVLVEEIDQRQEVELDKKISIHSLNANIFLTTK